MREDLPADIVKRFDGKVMAIVGIETDQVRKTDKGDVRVPISASYNHHHDTAVVGHGSRLVELPMDHPRVKRAGHGNYIPLSGGTAWLPEEHTPSASGMRTSAMFSDGNGGEYRKCAAALTHERTHARTARAPTCALYLSRQEIRTMPVCPLAHAQAAVCLLAADRSMPTRHPSQ